MNLKALIITLILIGAYFGVMVVIYFIGGIFV